MNDSREGSFRSRFAFDVTTRFTLTPEWDHASSARPTILIAETPATEHGTDLQAMIFLRMTTGTHGNPPDEIP